MPRCVVVFFRKKTYVLSAFARPCAHTRRAICITPAVFATPLYAQETPDVQTQITAIQASLKQMRAEYEQHIRALESKVSQLQQENAQLANQANPPRPSTQGASFETYPPLPSSRKDTTTTADSSSAKPLSKAQQRIAKADGARIESRR